MDANPCKVGYLRQKACELREHIIDMIHVAKSGHPGGSLSIADVVTALYFDELKIDPEHPMRAERDRVILSKGHCCPVIYGVLAMKGFFKVEELQTLRKMGSILQGHPDMKKVPGLDMTSGSLGQGLSVGVGMAIGAKALDIDSRVYVILGDGELNEGQVWEAAMSAAKFKLDNLTAIVDCNNLQVDGFCQDIMPIEPIDKKWEAFGWHVIKIDGHDMEQILAAFATARKNIDAPTCILAETVKGKGISFMENVCEWHGMAPDDNQCLLAFRELKGGLAQ